jgi:hypothetical protein
MENYNNAIKHITENFKSVKEIAKLIGHKNVEQLANELRKHSDLDVKDKNNGFGDADYFVRLRKENINIINKTINGNNNRMDSSGDEIHFSNLPPTNPSNHPMLDAINTIATYLSNNPLSATIIGGIIVAIVLKIAFT